MSTRERGWGGPSAHLEVLQEVFLEDVTPEPGLEKDFRSSLLTDSHHLIEWS